MHLHTRNCNTAFVKLVQYFNGQRDVLRDPPVVRRSSRNGDVLMIDEPVTITYTHPRERVLFNSARDANPFFHVYEALWMLAGRNDVAPVAYYAKQMKEYSDDGGTLNGAYGYRWRRGNPNPHEHWTEDQLQIIINHLKADPNSRRAVLQMWNVEDDLLKIGMPCDNCQGTGTYKGRYTPDDPTSEYVEETCEDCDGEGKIGQSLDTCCNLSVMFSVRYETVNHSSDFKGYGLPGTPTLGKLTLGTPTVFLDMTVTNRSNDLVWGMLGANYVHFTFLQEYMAARLGVEVGRYHHFSNNLHAYVGEGPTAQWKPEEWLSDHEQKHNEYKSIEDGSVLKLVPLIRQPEVFEKELPEFVELHKGLVNGEEPPLRRGGWQEPFIANVASPMCRAFHAYKLHEKEQAMTWASRVHADDWRIAATSWLQRRKW